MRNGLADEERYHWSNVLLASPGHKQARQRLSMREYRGGLFTKAADRRARAASEERRRQSKKI